MVVHFQSSGTTSRPISKEQIAEIQRRLREQKADQEKNPEKQLIKIRRA
jgi:hypothetical protein